MRVDHLADHPEWMHLIAFMHQLEMREASERDFNWSIQQFSQRMNRDSLPMTLVAVEDTIPVGSVTLLENQLESHSNLTPWIASLFVLAQYRGCGIGSRLMREAELFASSIGYNSIYLFTHTAKSYYEAKGWNAIATVDPPDVRHTSVVMLKQL